MKRFVLLWCLAGLSFPVCAAEADPGLAEVIALGRLNGVALACSNSDIALKIKNAMIQYAPKSPRHGVGFEQVTSTSFLDQLKLGKSACPDGATLGGKVEAAVDTLRSAVSSAASN